MVEKMEEYSKKVIENFMSPKNMGEIENADGVGNTIWRSELVSVEKLSDDLCVGVAILS